jgi:hypothetical protein
MDIRLVEKLQEDVFQGADARELKQRIIDRQKMMDQELLAKKDHLKEVQRRFWEHTRITGSVSPATQEEAKAMRYARELTSYDNEFYIENPDAALGEINRIMQTCVVALARIEGEVR